MSDQGNNQNVDFLVNGAASTGLIYMFFSGLADLSKFSSKICGLAPSAKEQARINEKSHWEQVNREVTEYMRERYGD